MKGRFSVASDVLLVGGLLAVLAGLYLAFGWPAPLVVGGTLVMIYGIALDLRR